MFLLHGNRVALRGLWPSRDLLAELPEKVRQVFQKTSDGSLISVAIARLRYHVDVGIRTGALTRLGPFLTCSSVNMHGRTWLRGPLELSLTSDLRPPSDMSA
jgi:hypothetical protein